MVKAHIIPASLYPHRVTQAQLTKIYWRDPDAFPKRSSTGVYDRGILCATCEKRFQECDDYAQKILRARPSDQTPAYFTLHNFDYGLLKRFFISVLWRASVSSHQMFSRVNVGRQHESRLRALILSNDGIDPEEYAVVITSFDDPEAKEIVFQPTRRKLGAERVNVYHFLVAGFVIFIKADQRRMPDDFRSDILRPGGEVRVVVRHWSTSTEKRHVLEIVKTGKGP